VAIALPDPDVRVQLDQLGITPVGGNLEELLASFTAYMVRATEMIRSEGLRTD
jgi:hypothetical protein